MSGLTARFVRLPASSGVARLWPWLGAVALVLAAALVYAPALGSYLVRDDFAQLAYGRLLGTPWPLFWQDHFIPTGAFFRPLGFATLWLTTVLADSQVVVHYGVALGLHVLVSLALLGLLRRALDRSLQAWLLATAFAVSPIAIGTSLWLSDRFDLLAALFMLLALSQAWDYRNKGKNARLLCVVVYCLLAMLAKETGLLIVAPISLLWLGRNGWRPSLHVPWPALAAVWATVPLYLLWRMAVLGSLGGGSDIAAASPLLLLWHGGLAWLSHLPAWLSFWPRLSLWQQGLMVLALPCLLAGMTWPGQHDTTANRSAWALAGLALLVLPAAVQAPVAAISAAPLTASMSPIDAAMQTRLYYIALTGLTLILAACISGTRGLLRQRLAMLALAVLMVVPGVAAYQLADDYRGRSQAIRPMAEAAVAAVRQLPLPQDRCQIFFLDASPPAEWGRYAPFDSIVKALIPSLDKVDNCLIQTDVAPYFTLLRRGTLARTDIAPMTALPDRQDDTPLLRIGGLEVAALNLQADTDASTLDHGFFLAWDGHRFVDVTAAVHTGRKPVSFHCIRSADQCPPTPSKSVSKARH